MPYGPTSTRSLETLVDPSSAPGRLYPPFWSLPPGRGPEGPWHECSLWEIYCLSCSLAVHHCKIVNPQVPRRPSYPTSRGHWDTSKAYNKRVFTGYLWCMHRSAYSLLTRNAISSLLAALPSRGCVHVEGISSSPACSRACGGTGVRKKTGSSSHAAGRSWWRVDITAFATPTLLINSLSIILAAYRPK